LDWHELVNDALPPPRGDEPGGLRQDIADELADHFDCALRREQLRLADEDAAHDAALKKFGDPKLLAYRLWFDAMKESIMKDRVMIGAVVVMTAAVVGVAVMMFSMMGRQQDAFSQMLSMMQQMQAEGQDPGLPFGWGEVRVQLLSADGRAPVGGATAELDGYLFGDAVKASVRGATDGDGTIDFGAVRVGTHTVHVLLPDGRSSMRDMTVVPTTRRSEPQRYTIHCPPSFQRADVHLEVDWPDGWQALGTIVEFQLEHRVAATDVDGHVINMWHTVDEVTVTISPDGRVDFDGRVELVADASGERRIALACGTYVVKGVGYFMPGPDGQNTVKDAISASGHFMVSAEDENQIVLSVPDDAVRRAKVFMHRWDEVRRGGGRQ
jgi:hypothetical protein